MTLRLRAAARLLRVALGGAGLVMAGFAHANLNVAKTLDGANYPTTGLQAGELSAFRISLINDFLVDPITGVNFTDRVPSTLKVVRVVSVACRDGNGVADATTTLANTSVAGNNLVVSNATIPARNGGSTAGQCDFILEVSALSAVNGAENYIDVGDITGMHSGVQVSNDKAAAQTVSFGNPITPVLGKSFNPASVHKGHTSTVTLTVKNPSMVRPLNVTSLTDNLPAGLKVAGSPGASSTCTGTGSTLLGTASITAGNTAAQVGPGTVAPGQTCTVTFNVVTDVGPLNTAFVDRVNAISGSSHFVSDSLLTPADVAATLKVLSPLVVSKAFTPTEVAAGEQASLSIDIANNGTAPLTLGAFSDQIDGGTPNMVIDSVSQTGGAGCALTQLAFSGNRVSYSGGTLAAGQKCTLDIKYKAFLSNAGEKKTFTNTIPLGGVPATDADGAVQSNAAQSSVTVRDRFSVEKAGSTDKVTPGSLIQYTIKLYNWGAAAPVLVNDPLPAGLQFFGAPGYRPAVTGTGCTLEPNATSARFEVGMPKGINANAGICTLTFWAKVDDDITLPAQPISNQIPAGSGGVCAVADPSICAHESTAVATFQVVNPLLVTKAFDSPRKSEGEPATVTLTLENMSDKALTNVVLKDVLPTNKTSGAPLQIAVPSQHASTCGGVVSITGGSSPVVTLSGASVAPRQQPGSGLPGSCQVRFNVLGELGNYTNTVNKADVTATVSMHDGTTRAATVKDNASADVEYVSVLSGRKSFSPTVVQVGGRSTVTLTLANDNSATLTGVSVTDTLPAGLTVATPAKAYHTCDGNPQLTAVPGAQQVAFSGARIASKSTCAVLFDVVASGPGPWLNSIGKGQLSADGNVKNSLPFTATLNPQTGGGLNVEANHKMGTLGAPGAVTELTLTFTNNGNLDLTNLALDAFFRENGLLGGGLTGEQIAPVPNIRTTCVGAVVKAPANGTAFSLSGASLPAGSACSVTFDVTLSTAASATVAIPQGAVSTDQGVVNSMEAKSSLTTGTGLGLSKVFTPAVISVGQTSRLRIKLLNPTTQPISELKLVDTFPAGMVVASVPNKVNTCSGQLDLTPKATDPGVLTLSNGSLPAGTAQVPAECFVEVNVEVVREGEYVNNLPQGSLTGVTPLGPINNPEVSDGKLTAREAVEIHKAFDAKTLDGAVSGDFGFSQGVAVRKAGELFDLSIALKNPNTIALTNLTLVDDLPDGVALAPAPNVRKSAACSVNVSAPPSGRQVVLSNGTLAAGSLCTVTVAVVSNVAGSYTNTIRRNALTSSEGISNTVPTAAEVVITSPPSVSKEFNPPLINAGGESTLTIRVNNPNASVMTLTRNMVDPLPTVPGKVLVVAPGLVAAETTCAASDVIATAGSASVTLKSGAKVPANGCVIAVKVTGSSSGVHTNEIARDALQTDMGNNAEPAHSTLTVSSLGYIGGRVYLDSDGSKTFNAGDKPLAGSAISLHDGLTCSGPLRVFSNGVQNPQRTDAGGAYLFSELPQGTYTVCQAGQPTGTLNALPVPDAGAGGTASNPAAGGSQISGIVLSETGGQVSASPGNDFPEVQPGAISGTVFIDLNNDGKQDGADTGLVGVIITLEGEDDDGNTVTRDTVTDGNGDYRFDNLPPGKYTVSQPTQPAGTSNGQTTGGAIGGGTGSAVTDPISTISNITLGSGTHSTHNNFAELAQDRTITGKVFLDLDDNGLPASGEPGIDAQEIVLTGTDLNGNPIPARSVFTDKAGNFTFTGLPAGTYVLSQPNQPPGTLPGQTVAGSAGGTVTAPGTPSAISVIDLTTEQFSLDNYFAELPTPDLVIAKTHAPTELKAASNGVYIITVGNIGLGPTAGTVTVVDDLPTGLTPTGASGAGWTCTVSGQRVSCSTDTVIVPHTTLANSSVQIQVPVTVAGGLGGTTLTNVATVSGGSELPGNTSNNSASDPATINRSVTSLEGTVWFDTNHNRILDPGEKLMPGWSVELLLAGKVVATTITDTNGQYRFNDVVPDRGYEVRFLHPETGTFYGRAVPNETGAPFTSGVVHANNPAGASNEGGTLKDLTLVAGTHTPQQSLPLDPAGVVYDAVTRAPVRGAVVRIEGPAGFMASDVIGGKAEQVTGSDGWYQFLLLPSAPAGTYRLSVTSPAGYVQGPSQIIPACQATLNVGPFPDPALVQVQNTAPSTSSSLHEPAQCPASSAGLTAGSSSTQHYYSFVLGSGSANLLNNHLPLDPILNGAIVMTKVTPKVNVTRGELVPYTLTARNTLSSVLQGIAIEDQIPPGFKYVKGSAQVDGVALEPTVTGRLLRWPDRTFKAGQLVTLKMILVVGSGVGFSEYVNQTWALNLLANARVSNVASASVRVVADPTFDCSDLIGTVFDDKNRNGYQDEGEPGIAGVRLATPKGWLVTSDQHGRFHIACADVPNELRGTNFILKVDERSLPSGYRITTENPRVVRMTQGRLVKANFGASIHRVVRLDLTSQAFAADNRLTAQYQARLGEVLTLLYAEPSILRIGYRMPVDSDVRDARQRVGYVRKWFEDQWKPHDCCYDLQLEEEIVPAADSVEVIR